MDPSESTTQPTTSTTSPAVEPKVTDMPLVPVTEQKAAPTQVTLPAEPPTPVTSETNSVPPQTTSPIALASDSQNGFLQMIMENKKIVIIGVVAVIAIIVGISVLIGAKSSDEYQGLIKRIDTETQELNKASQNNVLAPAQSISTDSSTSSSEDIIPILDEEPESDKIPR